MVKPRTEGIRLLATDVSQQRIAKVSNVPRDSTVGELVQDLLGEMELPRTDLNGRRLTYHARLEREGRHIHASEVVGEALQDDDRIVLQPNVDAG